MQGEILYADTWETIYTVRYSYIYTYTLVISRIDEVNAAMIRCSWRLILTSMESYMQLYIYGVMHSIETLPCSHIHSNIYTLS